MRKAKNGFVLVFVLAAILALSVVCMHALGLMSLSLRSNAAKTRSIEQIYLVEQGLAAGKALLGLRPVTATGGGAETFSPAPGLSVTVADENAKTPVFGLTATEADAAAQYEALFARLAGGETALKLGALAKTHRPANSDSPQDLPTLFPAHAAGLPDEGAAKDGCGLAAVTTPLKTRGINVNTASERVLAALFSDNMLVRAIVNARKKAPIADKAALTAILGAPDALEVCEKCLAFGSEFYSITARADKDPAATAPLSARLYVRVSRDENGAARIKELFCEEIAPGPDA